MAPLDDPRSIGESPKGSRLGEFWKYRVGDDRIISSIQDGALRILVVKIGNRREVSRKTISRHGHICHRPASWRHLVIGILKSVSVD